jgi:hypothetical protein
VALPPCQNRFYGWNIPSRDCPKCGGFALEKIRASRADDREMAEAHPRFRPYRCPSLPLSFSAA